MFGGSKEVARANPVNTSMLSAELGFNNSNESSPKHSFSRVSADDRVSEASTDERPIANPSPTTDSKKNALTYSSSHFSPPSDVAVGQPKAVLTQDNPVANFEQVEQRLATVVVPAGMTKVLVFVSRRLLKQIKSWGFRAEMHREGGGGFYCVRNFGTFGFEGPEVDWADNTMTALLGSGFEREDQRRYCECVMVCCVPENVLQKVEFPDEDVRKDEDNEMPLWYWPMDNLIKQNIDVKNGHRYLSYKHVQVLDVIALMPASKDSEASIGEDIADELFHNGMELQEVNEINAAFEKLGKSLAMRKTLVGEDHVDVGWTLEQIGVCLNTNHQHKEALQQHKQALEILTKHLGENHESVAAVYNSLGNAHDALNNDGEAKECHHKSLEIRICVFGNVHLTVANSYNNLGVVHHCLGENELAEQCFSKCADIQKTILGEHDGRVGATYCNLGNVCCRLGKHKKAKDYLVKGLDIWVKSVGRHHPAVAAAYFNLSSLYRTMGEYSDAIAMSRQGIEVKMRLIGENKDHQTIADATYNIALMYEELGKTSQAREYFLDSGGMYTRLVRPELAEEAFEGADRCQVKGACCTSMLKRFCVGQGRHQLHGEHGTPPQNAHQVLSLL